MSSIITMYGNIATGKSTLSKALAGRFPNLVVINDDAIRTMLGAGDYGKGFRALGAYQMEAWIANILPTLLINGRDVLIDIPAHTNAIRKLFEQSTVCMGGSCHGGGVGYYSINMGWHAFPAIHATSRFLSDSRGYSEEQWLSVATRLDSERQEPEAPWSKISYGQVTRMINQLVDTNQYPTFSVALVRGLSSGLL